MLSIVLVEPEIPQNAGNVARTCACVGAQLHLVEPMGFRLTSKQLGRAGCDYWDKVEERRWPCAEAFFEAHEFIYIVTPDKVRVYRVYGWVNYDDRHIMASYDFSEEEQCRAFLDSLSEDGTESRFREEMEVTEEDRLLTLSTCVKGQEDRRFLVEAVLTEEWER